MLNKIKFRRKNKNNNSSSRDKNQKSLRYTRGGPNFAKTKRIKQKLSSTEKKLIHNEWFL